MKGTLKKEGWLKSQRCARATPRAAALAALLLLVCAAATTAQTPSDDSQPPAREETARPRREAAGPDLVRALNLSNEQRTEIARIRSEVAPQTRAANQRVRRARLALEEAVYAPAADESLIEQRAAEVAAAEGARVRLRSQTELRIRRLLSPEQLNAFRELRLRALARQQQRLNRRPAQGRLPRDERRQFPPAEPTAADPESNPADPTLRQSPRMRRLPAARRSRRQPAPPRP
jgi:Spy/CpxP family protein refolding chaperone